MTMTKQNLAHNHNNNMDIGDPKQTTVGDKPKMDAIGALMTGTKMTGAVMKEIGSIEGGPTDCTPMLSTLGQNRMVCAAGNLCVGTFL